MHLHARVRCERHWGVVAQKPIVGRYGIARPLPSLVFKVPPLCHGFSRSTQVFPLFARYRACRLCFGFDQDCFKRFPLFHCRVCNLLGRHKKVSKVGHNNAIQFRTWVFDNFRHGEVRVTEGGVAPLFFFGKVSQIGGTGLQNVHIRCTSANVCTPCAKRRGGLVDKAPVDPHYSGRGFDFGAHFFL